MTDVLEIDNREAVVDFDPEIGMFRGEFVGLSGGADFYATSFESPVGEGRRSLAAYLDVCAEKGIAAIGSEEAS